MAVRAAGSTVYSTTQQTAMGAQSSPGVGAPYNPVGWGLIPCRDPPRIPSCAHPPSSSSRGVDRPSDTMPSLHLKRLQRLWVAACALALVVIASCALTPAANAALAGTPSATALPAANGSLILLTNKNLAPIAYLDHGVPSGLAARSDPRDRGADAAVRADPGDGLGAGADAGGIGTGRRAHPDQPDAGAQEGLRLLTVLTCYDASFATLVGD